jgi:hypothetical protein
MEVGEEYTRESIGFRMLNTSRTRILQPHSRCDPPACEIPSNTSTGLFQSLIREEGGLYGLMRIIRPKKCSDDATVGPAAAHN